MKFKVDHVKFVVHRLGLAVVNLHSKFEVSTFTCNEDMKGNAEICKHSHLSHPLRDLGVTHRVHLWLTAKRIVDCLLAIIELFR